MKTRLLILLLAAPLLLLAQDIPFGLGDSTLITPAQSDSTNCPVSIPYSTDFETTITPPTCEWTNSAGSPSYNDTTSPITGSKSLRLADNGTIAQFNLNTNVADIYIYCRWRETGSATGFKGVIYTDGGAGLLHTSDGGWYFSGPVNNNYPSGWSGPGSGTAYYMWLEFHKGTGANGHMNLKLGVTGTKASATDMDWTGGDNTSNFSAIYLYGWDTSAPVDIDDFKVRSTSAFGDNGS